MNTYILDMHTVVNRTVISGSAKIKTFNKSLAKTIAFRINTDFCREVAGKMVTPARIIRLYKTDKI